MARHLAPRRRGETARPAGRRAPRGGCAARMRIALDADRARGSPTAAIGWGLHVGLPLTAILIALNPVWGVSWFFNTENWVTGAWERWAEHRTDTWREDMVGRGARGVPDDGVRDADFFRVDAARAWTARATSASSSSATPARATPRSTSCATSTCALGAEAGREVPGRLVGRDLPVGRDEGLRAEVLPAVQGLRQADLRDPRQPRLVRRAGSVHRQLPRAAGGAGRAARPARGGPQAHDHDRGRASTT